MDPRTRKVAQLVAQKMKIKKDDNVVITGGTESEDMVRELYKEVILKGGNPILRVQISGLSSFFYKYAKKHQIEKYPDFLDYLAQNSQKYIGINSEVNTRELSEADPKKIAARQRIVRPLVDKINNSKPDLMRCNVAYPCYAHAQEAEMDFTDYENFVYSAILQDWEKVGKKIKTVLKRFRAGKKVHLLGDGVDLKFQINGKLASSDLTGENIPMGEVFMAPVKETVNGFIKFEYPAIYAGKEVTDVFLKFEKGKVIEATASKNEKFLNEMINSDENASYVGEFGIGLNSNINRFTKNLGFDEKIDGTIHLALGMAYKDNGGGNDSSIHWDIVKNMKKAKIILDEKVVQKNGKWKI